MNEGWRILVGACLDLKLSWKETKLLSTAQTFYVRETWGTKLNQQLEHKISGDKSEKHLLIYISFIIYIRTPAAVAALPTTTWSHFMFITRRVEQQQTDLEEHNAVNPPCNNVTQNTRRTKLNLHKMQRNLYLKKRERESTSVIDSFLMFQPDNCTFHIPHLRQTHTPTEKPREATRSSNIWEPPKEMFFTSVLDSHAAVTNTFPQYKVYLDTDTVKV